MSRSESGPAGAPMSRSDRGTAGADRSGPGTVLANGRLPDGRVVDVHVAGGRITEVVPAAASAHAGLARPGAAQHAERIELGGWLLVPAMAEPHAHLDKALTADAVPNPVGDLMGAIEAWNLAASRGDLGHENTVERAAAAMELLLVSGVTAVRTHVNVLPPVGAAKVVAVREAAARFAGLLDVQVVALTGVPTSDAEVAPMVRALDEALAAGADVIGGCPHLEADGPAFIAERLRIAAEAHLPVDLHVDETLDPEMLTLVDLARRVAETGFDLGVTASHCVSLGVQPARRQDEIAAEVAAAGVAVVTLPQTNLFLQGRDRPTSTPRGLTAIGALRDAGALVAAGADNVQDPFNLVGRSDPLETAALLVMAGHRTPDVAYEMVSNDARSVLGLAPVRLAAGDSADLVAIDAPSIRAAIADAPMRRRVFKGGRLVASSDQSASIHR